MQTRLVYVGGPKNGFTEVSNLPLNTAKLGVIVIDNPSSESEYWLHDIASQSDQRVAIAYHDTMELKDALEQVFEAFIMLNGTKL